MMKMSRLMAQVVLLGFSVLVLSGCGKSIEKETKRWESNQQKAESLKTVCPGYTELIASEMDQAATQWDQALQGEGGKEQIQALAQVNTFVKRGVICELLDIKSQLSSADRKVDQLLKMPKDSTEDVAASFAVKEARAAILKAKEVLASENSDYQKAISSLSSAGAGLQSAETSLDKIIRTIRKNDQASQQKVTDSTKVSVPKSTTSTSTQTQSTTWKCSYCGAKNLNSVTKCKSCGAPRE